MSKALYVRVKREVKEKLERLAKERGVYLVDVASEALEQGLGFQPTQQTAQATGLAERLIGTWRMKNCRFPTEDGYCSAWEMPKDEAERIYGEDVKQILEKRDVERPVWFGVERDEVYSVKPSPTLCFHCPFFERR
jgi:predicted transcriptional regulator